MLTVDDLTVAYGQSEVLHGLSLTAAKAEIVAVMGRNGMGKTTLMRSIMGYVKVTGGEINFDGKSILGTPVNARAKMGIGLVPQGRQIFPNLSVEENLHVAIPGNKTEVARTTDEMLELFPRLKRLLDRRGGALSGGEQQLLALARCLARHPRLMLLDEPTEGIQPSIIDEISETLASLTKKIDITIVLVEQNLDFITGLSDRVYAISNGVLDREIPKAELTDAGAVSAFMGFTA